MILEVALIFLASYLDGRIQYTEIRSVDDDGFVWRCTSKTTNNLVNVPQGSMLGPLLFLLCVSNFFRAIC